LFPWGAIFVEFAYFHRETMGLEGGGSSLVGEGRNFEGGVVKFLDMMNF